MTTIIGIVACGVALWVAGRNVPRMRRLEEAVIRQEERMLYLTLYAQRLEESMLDLVDDMDILQDTLGEDYPDLLEPPQPDYPPAYDKWGEFDV